MFLFLAVVSFALFFRVADAYNNTWQFEVLDLNCSWSYHTIHSQSDFDQLATCNTSEYGQILLGDVKIGSGFEGYLNISTVDSINGSISAQYKDNFTGLISTRLTYVIAIEFFVLSNFTTFQMDSLSYFQDIVIESLPLLENMGLSPNTASQGIGAISIQESGLISFTGLDGYDVWTSSLEFYNNYNLKSLDLSGVRYPKGTDYTIAITGGSSGVDVDLSGLQYVNTLSLKNVTSLLAPNLLEIYYLSITNDVAESISMESISMDSLNHVESIMTISYNPQLRTISFPALNESHYLWISDNPLLQLNESSFSSLTNADEIEIFTSLSGNVLPKLHTCSSLELRTYNSDFSCRKMDKRVRKKKMTDSHSHEVGYSCRVFDAAGEDISKHWHHFKLTHGAKLVIIIISVVVGVTVLFFLLYCINRGPMTEDAGLEQGQLQDDGEELPQYSATDSPPKYESPSVHSVTTESFNNGPSGDNNAHAVQGEIVGSTDHAVLHP